MKIAFATQDKVHVDAHFGWAKNIVVYDVTAEGHKFIEIFDFSDTPQKHGNEEKLGRRLEVIRDCAVLCVAAIGGAGAARVVALKIHPIKVAQAEPIEVILRRLQEVLKGTPPPWLRKAIKKDVGTSHDFAADDELPDSRAYCKEDDFALRNKLLVTETGREDKINDPEEKKARLKKLNALAVQAKMDLHDLSEELPASWEKILIVAGRCHEIHAALMEARKSAGAAYK
ncbi:nitrogen fixation protein NifX [Cupriavidus sp. UYMU48A]|nr:nitrogen fixation protein NifX [Cupriavidus sp. UYMU48A]